ncbi:hypothetical protein [Streptomyces avermitilis]|uniref:Secreted protein n=2 Tax=Streptomyces avermitilis TaxID=33903 RepID=A0A143SZJ9_STRAW|nr:hypothetical protein [Streptomyces avermitilis]BAU77479.1 hypothetical protein SAVERM_2p035 [Streptomyces avermitilis MA-4680 = NBRC 14893]BBJ56304.1 hypothetical protein SAVMC3_89330 [Streptomyces avermitilis]GDY70148.1 hypothetical protein SAV14893_095410 [Streptomyces avermitilis]GDY80445.1 hypothetical protein SAV31267_099300 [Streptomyces avermitilis]
MEDNVRKLSTIAVCSITAATTLFAVGTTAWSANFDNMFKTANANWDCRDGERDNGLFCRTDNAEMTIVREPGMTSQGDKDIVTTLRNEYSPTDLKVYIESEGVYNGDTPGRPQHRGPVPLLRQGDSPQPAARERPDRTGLECCRRCLTAAGGTSSLYAREQRDPPVTN